MQSLESVSKLIALVLRHKPEALSLRMDGHGWISTADLIEKLNGRQPFTMEMLEEIVRTDNKQRYSFNSDKTKIRANQGHSIPVDLELLPLEPPAVLWHGTGEKYVESINQKGLLKQSRQYVHLTDNHDTAIAVGKRHGKPVVYAVDAHAMWQEGYAFFRSENGVWLTDHVPAAFLHIS
ncbi:MAG: RNA 2'-phosphotransferase [Clostridia bacterium]|nr:RNA 2'-phosphotransferase [Clostridia bacterium]